MERLFESLAENVSEACFEDIMGIVEKIINEGGNLEKTVIRVRKKGKIDTDKSSELRVKANKVPGTNDTHFNSSGKLITDGDPTKNEGKKSERNITSDNGHRFNDEPQIYKSIDKNLRKNNPGTKSYQNTPSSTQFKKVNKYIKGDAVRVDWTPKNKKNYLKATN